jgi:hypothetical protein
VGTPLSHVLRRRMLTAVIFGIWRVVLHTQSLG